MKKRVENQVGGFAGNGYTPKGVYTPCGVPFPPTFQPHRFSPFADLRKNGKTANPPTRQPRRGGNGVKYGKAVRR